MVYLGQKLTEEGVGVSEEERTGVHVEVDS